MPSLYSNASFLSTENLSAANQQNGAKKTLPAVTAYASSAAPVQRAISNSAHYTPPGNATGDIVALHAQVAVAEQAATVDVNNPLIVHSPLQASYMRNPSKRAWGSCVEEKLNPLARNLNWTTQHVLTSSRPDYRKVIGVNEVFADITSAAEAGQHGNHITGKLDVSAPNGIRPATWKGADITHASSDPLGNGPAAVIGTNGVVTLEHAQYYQDYRNFLNHRNGGDWSPGMQHLLDHYKGPVSNATFSQVWDQNDRDQFVNLAKQELDDDGGSSEGWNSESDNDEPVNNQMDTESDNGEGDNNEYVDNGNDEYSDDHSI